MRKLGQLVHERGGATPSKDRVDYWTGEIPWVSPKDMKVSLLGDAIDHVSPRAVAETSLQLIPAGSVLMVVRGMILAHSVPVALTTAPVTINQDMKALVPAGDVSGLYLRYTLQAHRDPLLALVEEAGHGTRCLRSELWRRFEVPVPPLPTQQAIADFLDRKTAAIDALIEKKQALLDRLAEKRTALINQAVTRGLDPTVPMKDSGVPWLGAIPAHWEVKQVRHALRGIEQGWSPQCEARTAVEGEWGVLKAGCTAGGVFRADEHKALPSNLEARPALQVVEGDLLMSRASGSPDIVGSAALVRELHQKLLLSDKIFRLRIEGAVTTGPFLAIALGSRSARYQIENAISGADGLANNLPQARLKDILLVFPPVEEQRTIMAAVNAAAATMMRLTENLDASITRLQEYRQALITAAVTGQLELP